MVNTQRPDPITRREFPLRNAGVARRELYRQRLLRDRPSVARQLFIDRDEIPAGVTRAATDREDTLFDLSFAPLPPEFNPEAVTNRNLPAIPAGEESEKEDITETIYSDSSSDASTIIVDLNNPTDGIPLGLLRAWERNAEIPATRDQQVQTSPPPSPPRTPDSFSGYFPPNYSPVALGEIDLEPIDISPSEESSIDWETNQILDYLNSEEFLDSIVDL